MKNFVQLAVLGNLKLQPSKKLIIFNDALIFGEKLIIFSSNPVNIISQALNLVYKQYLGRSLNLIQVKC